jgi:hypothetical protein
LTQPGIPNDYALATTTFGSRLKAIEDQDFAAVAMGFRRMELGLLEAPVSLGGFEDSARETGIVVSAIITGCLDPKAENMSGTKLGSLDAELREQLAGEGPGRHAGRGFAGTRPLEHRADAAQVLDRAGQVGMAGPRPLDLLEPFELGVFVDDLERERAAERDALPETGEERDGIGLDPLSPPAAIAPLPAPQLGVDERDIDGEARGKTVDERHEGGPVRFTGGPIAEHGGIRAGRDG